MHFAALRDAAAEVADTEEGREEMKELELEKEKEGLRVPSHVAYASFSDAVAASLPYAVVIDPGSRSVVLCVRGTLSFEDALTDALCEAAPLLPAMRLTTRRMAERVAANPGAIEEGGVEEEEEQEEGKRAGRRTLGRYYYDPEKIIASSRRTTGSSSAQNTDVAACDGGAPQCHQGMLSAALHILDDVQRHRLLRRLLVEGKVADEEASFPTSLATGAPSEGAPLDL